MKARLLTIVWGEKHIDWFERACLASLALPANLAALRHHCECWDIVTSPEDQARLTALALPLWLPLKFHEADFSADHGDVLQLSIIKAMERCRDDDLALFIAPPDTIFGDGSIGSICAVGQPRHTCVAVPHVRVLPRLLETADCARSNAALVAAAWRNLHRTWVECDVERDTTNSFYGGTSWQRIGPGLYGVTHLLPTVYLAHFNETDIGWWHAQTKSGAWDHRWPSKLVAEARQRVIGSSDAAFMVELTDEFANVPPVTRNDLDTPAKYWGQAAHNVMNFNGLCVFRAEVAA